MKMSTENRSVENLTIIPYNDIVLIEANLKLMEVNNLIIRRERLEDYDEVYHVIKKHLKSRTF